MTKGNLGDQAQYYISKLCLEIGERPVGSPGNREASDFIAGTMGAFGFRVETQEFDCFDWFDGGSTLQAGDEHFQVFSSPYTSGVQFRGPLSAAATTSELERVEAEGRIVLLHGPVASEQLMPKNFTFYNPKEHQAIINLLETRGFSAVAAATSRNPELAGGLYPFPLIEDGDFNLPSVYMTDREGERLLSGPPGREIILDIKAERRPARGCNVIASRGGGGHKVVVTAHLDSKSSTPGAVDNASGIAVLLLLAELLAGYEGTLDIELAALNGEDYYSNPGEMLYLEKNRDNFEQIMLGINIDGAGYRRGGTAYSLYGCPEQITALADKILGSEAGFMAGEPWYQGDHGLFIHNNRPALALTSTAAGDLLNIVHTPGDNPDIIDYDQVAGIGRALQRLLLELTKMRQ